MTSSYSNLLAVLNTSRALKANDGAYQTIKQLLQALDTNQTTTNNQLTVNTNGLDGPIVTYATAAGLANSRELVAGTNITFDESFGGELVINASGGGSGSDSFAFFIS